MFYLNRVFCKIACYLVELFQQIVRYLAELFQHIALPNTWHSITQDYHCGTSKYNQNYNSKYWNLISSPSDGFCPFPQLLFQEPIRNIPDNVFLFKGVCIQLLTPEMTNMLSDSEEWNYLPTNSKKNKRLMIPILLFLGIQEQNLKVTITKVGYPEFREAL